MALPETQRIDLLEFLGGAFVDESQIPALIDRIREEISAASQRGAMPDPQ